MAACDDLALGVGPNRDDIVLTACKNVFTVGRPADTDDAAEVAVENVEESSLVSGSCRRGRYESTHFSLI